MEQEISRTEKGSCLGQSLKILGALALAVIIILGAFYITGKFLTNRIETETDIQESESWGPGPSFSRRDPERHIFSI